NEDGKLLATFDSKDWLDDIIKFNGTSYLVTSGDNTTLYKLDSKTSSIKEVKQFNAKAFSVGVNNRSITVDTGDQKADEAILFDMQGRKVAVSSNQNSNRLSINAGNVPQGIYNVTVKNQGKMERAQKVRIK
ncbi:MAG: T9SS type A sorting domain-containing protein, partial [Bacteroidaceae bacterium]|nr:T9SS type A sorting domain-containing protein [Bacteroidaceae bacterium]